MQAITVLLADDHPIFRDGLAHALAQREEISLVATLEDGRQALDAIRRLRPDVAVLDLQLPGIDGLTVIDAARRERLPTRALVVSARYDSATVYQAIEVGACGYLPKLSGAEEVFAAIVTVARGGTVVPSELQEGLASEIRLRRVDHRPTLTPRELEIVRLAADGQPNAAIALQLHVSTATVKTHLQHVYEKLEVSDRASAVAQAIRRGLLP